MQGRPYGRPGGATVRNGRRFAKRKRPCNRIRRLGGSYIFGRFIPPVAAFR